MVYATPAYYAPSYYPTPTIAPPPAPATYYESALPPAEYSTVTPPARPTIVVGFQGRLFGGSIAFRPGARAAAVPVPQRPLPETTPTPRPTDSFRYDGGPASPVPMPAPDVAPPTDPIPTTVPALHRVMFERSRQTAVYPAYGERQRRSATRDPLLVKWPASR
jgi:hypothetical protein